MTRKILSLNIRHGGGSRGPAILDWIAQESPDFLILVEWCNNRQGAELVSALKQSGYHTSTFSRGGPRDNGILLASRHAFTASAQTPHEATHGELVLAQTSGLMICGTYFPQKKEKIPFFEKLNKLSAQYTEIPLIILGDINTGDNAVDLQAGATRYDCADMFTDLHNKYGLIDIWRHQHGANIREWTWISTNKGNGYRLDHAFANTCFLEYFPEASCRYDHSTREGIHRITDHSGLILNLD